MNKTKCSNDSAVDMKRCLLVVSAVIMMYIVTMSRDRLCFY